MKVYAYIIALVFVTSASFSFGQTTEEKKLAVAKNYMLQHHLDSEHIKVNLNTVISVDSWERLKQKLLGFESVYFMAINDDKTVVTLKSYMIDHKTLESKAKASIQDVINHEVDFTYEINETIQKED